MVLLKERSLYPSPIPMQSLTVPPVINYSITPIKGGVLLRIWENAPVTSTRVKPLMFMARYRVETEEDAKAILKFYRAAYRSSNAIYNIQEA